MKDKIRLYFINKYLVSMHDQFLMEITKKQNVVYNANMIANNLILLQLQCPPKNLPIVKLFPKLFPDGQGCQFVM